MLRLAIRPEEDHYQRCLSSHDQSAREIERDDMEKEDLNVCEKGEKKKKLSTESIIVIPLHTCHFYAWLTTFRWMKNDRKAKGKGEKQREG